MTMTDDTYAARVAAPALPKGGGAIQSIGKGWGAVGVTGAASMEIALPISAGRGFTPAMSLSYSSQGGRTQFGQGWQVGVPCIARRTGKRTPAYDDTDEFVAPNGDVLVPEVGPDGNIVSRKMSAFRGAAMAGDYTVTRHFTRVQGSNDRIESWRNATAWFWLIHDAQGNVHVYGKTARTEAPGVTNDDNDNDIAPRIAEWWLEESVAPNGERIRYRYSVDSIDTGNAIRSALSDDNVAPHVYLTHVCYGNVNASLIPSTLLGDTSPDDAWCFELVFDYGERPTGMEDVPPYDTDLPRPERADPFSSFAFGVEHRTRWLCRQVLMFHRFDELGDAPVLVRRLLIEYDESPIRSLLVAAHDIGYGAQADATWSAPIEYGYTPFLPPHEATFQTLPAMPGLNDGARYQLVDLYGEGIPGVLYHTNDGWHYREPLRAEADDVNESRARNEDAITYGPAQLLDQIPPRNAASPISQSLVDMTGDGRLDWVIATPGLAGFFTLGPERQWSDFFPFAAFPSEFAHPDGQLADLMGAGLSDLALIGPRSVRLYANRRDQGFAAPVDIPHAHALPCRTDGRSELVALSDILGTGQPHLVRVRQDEITVWPNLGRGRFGAARPFSNVPRWPDEFDASRVRLVDLDGSGPTDLIYLQPDGVAIFLNESGNGWSGMGKLAWPEGVVYDPTCEVSFADINGLGCPSLVLSVPHMTPRHWVCDFARSGKPYLLASSDNNMGTAGEVRFRSSAQEWLDEKRERQAGGEIAVSGVPFPLHVVVEQRQTDQISDAQLRQHFQYRHGYYDPIERELRGFGLVLQYDAELPAQNATPEDGFTAPALTKTWYHIGRDDWPGIDTYDVSDTEAVPLGATIRCHFNVSDNSDTPADDWDDETRRDMARALSGSVARTETFGLDAQDTPPFSISDTRYLVRLKQARSAHARYAVVQPLIAESRNFDYERQPSDPRCQHTLGLRWDTNGSALHGAIVYYARRNNSSPFDEHDMWSTRWWEDAHDIAQQQWYVTDTRGAWYDIDRDDAWRVAIPWRNREDALVFGFDALTPASVHYEAFVVADSPLDQADERQLAAMSEVHYFADADGAPSLAALPEYVELAELDDYALTAYDDVLTTEALNVELSAAGYEPMRAFMPERAMTLWAVHRQFPTFSPLEDFHQIVAYRETRSLGQTTLEYDAHRCCATRMTTPDGCSTQTTYDYRTLLPERIVDPNQNTQEARYDSFGRLQVTSFHGTEHGEPAGFMPLSDYVREIESPTDAIAAPQAALQDAATAVFTDALSWMGQVDEVPLDAEWVRSRWVLPDGHVRASARKLAHAVLATFDASSVEDVAKVASRVAMPIAVAQVLLAARRRPPHTLALQADRYPDDPARQIRMQLTDSDGFGRALQQKQLAPAGDAYQVLDDGTLALGPDDKPVTHHADQRWRVSERVEYNNKGLPVRVYRPYFADSPVYVRDESLRDFGCHDRQYYDPLGRPTVTLTAPGYLRRQTYWAWHTVSEDENDTAHELE
ncbi:Mono(ADP-ribosyl)transferase SpvB [Pandoraea anapnoica]|uniref:Mono(ADP-ribosyl)transferase SpvB n=2 Tax=Pandoraea anapnoica TaxID=2508301 RepID=A0A5E4ZVJ8_9BURK|nr:Mono(ADP-ribosyl)transferase SpvB [Pandoraea anapnoica]